MGNKSSFKEVVQRWRAVGNTVSVLTDPRFEPHTSRSRDKHVVVRPTGRFGNKSEKNEPLNELRHMSSRIAYLQSITAYSTADVLQNIIAG